jgi:NADH:ubiquinone oxidoreductase subunit 5 (subunit L)/multisubunit Na+/H+ antiporter MnhA subunit
LLWVLWLVPFLLLVGIGFLGGRGWKTRAAGPLVILFFVSLVMFLGVMLSWGQWGGDLKLQDLVPWTYEAHGVGAVWDIKANEIYNNTVGSIIDNMQDMYMYMVIASGVGLAGVGVWWIISARRNKGVEV